MNELLRHFTVAIVGAVLLICAISELWRWWTTPIEDDDVPRY